MSVDPFAFNLALVEDNDIQRLVCHNKRATVLDEYSKITIFAYEINPEIPEADYD
jgi:hypothetical protein